MASLALQFERQAEDHAARIDALVNEFEHQLRAVITKASARTLIELQQKLSITDGVIDPTPPNQRILRGLSDLYEQELDRAGYESLIDSYVRRFNGQLPEFQRVIDLLNERLKEPLLVKFSKADKDFFVAQQVSTAHSLKAAIENTADIAQHKTLFSFAGLKTADMGEMIATQFQRGLAEAVRIADTGISVFYRMVADRGYRQVEGNSEEALRYQYFGPDDRITRPFCKHLIESGKDYTRPQIEQMDNGQLPNPMLSGGGYNCRHQWTVSILDESPAKAP